MPAPKLDARCVTCARLLAIERFPLLAGPKALRSRICEHCHAARQKPRPCAGCAQLIAPADFAKLASGRTSKLCRECKDRGPAMRPCLRCKLTKPASAFERYSNGSRARSCVNCLRKERQPRVCKKCKKLLPHDAFARYLNNNRASHCKACYVPRPQLPRGPKQSPNPCRVCNGPIVLQLPPSKLAQRMTCSTRCEQLSRRNCTHRCTRCQRVLPFEAFDRKKGNYSRKGSCRECLAEDGDDSLMRPSIATLRLRLKKMADNKGAAFDLTVRSVRKLHAQPCELCGKSMTTVLLRDRTAGYVPANCRPVCRLCRRLCARMSVQELVLLANEIALRHPLEPGVKPCRCRRSKASKSCGGAKKNASG